MKDLNHFFNENFAYNLIYLNYFYELIGKKKPPVNYIMIEYLGYFASIIIDSLRLMRRIDTTIPILVYLLK
jgi:hypothetical protein